MKKHCLFLSFTLLTFLTFAQNTMYFMEHMPQKQFFNPALMPKMDFYLNLPGINGFSVDAYNHGFNFNELDNFLDNIKDANYAPENFINSISKNSFHSEGRLNLFGFGFKVKDKTFISFSATTHSTFFLDADPQIAYLLSDYNDITEDNFPVTIEGVDLNLNTYMNIGFNYIRKINSHLTIGINPNLTSYLAGVKTEKMKYVLDIVSVDEYGNKEFFETFTGEALLGLPAEIKPEIISQGEFEFGENVLSDNWEEEMNVSDVFANKNFSFNLGAVYQLNKWHFSASLLNIGTANWKRNAYRLKGIDDVINISEEKVNIAVPAKSYLGVARQFSPRWNYGLMMENIFYPEKVATSATLSLNGAVGRMLSTSFSYTAGYKFDNLGVGIRLRFFPGMDIYVVTDNLIQAFNYQNAYRVSGSAGINFSIGLKKHLAPRNKSDKNSEV